MLPSRSRRKVGCCRTRRDERRLELGRGKDGGSLVSRLRCSVVGEGRRDLTRLKGRSEILEVEMEFL